MSFSQEERGHSSCPGGFCPSCCTRCPLNTPPSCHLGLILPRQALLWQNFLLPKLPGSLRSTSLGTAGNVPAEPVARLTVVAALWGCQRGGYTLHVPRRRNRALVCLSAPPSEGVPHNPISGTNMWWGALILGGPPASRCYMAGLFGSRAARCLFASGPDLLWPRPPAPSQSSNPPWAS